MRNSDRKLLLASIQDVGPGFDREVDAVAELLRRRLGGNHQDFLDLLPLDRLAKKIARFIILREPGI